MDNTESFNLWYEFFNTHNNNMDLSSINTQELKDEINKFHKRFPEKYDYITATQRYINVLEIELNRRLEAERAEKLEVFNNE